MKQSAPLTIKSNSIVIIPSIDSIAAQLQKCLDTAHKYIDGVERLKELEINEYIIKSKKKTSEKTIIKELGKLISMNPILSEHVDILIKELPKNIRILKQYGVLPLNANKGKSNSPLFKDGGKAWKIFFKDKEILLPETDGLKYIGFLIKNCPKEFSPQDLYFAINPPKNYLKPQEVIEVKEENNINTSIIQRKEFQSRDSKMDKIGLIACKNKVEELNDALAETDDPGKKAEIKEEIAVIEKEIKSATVKGRGEKIREYNISNERSRTKVYNAIKRGLDAIKETKHLDLFKHLDDSIITRKYLSYQPKRPIPWHVDLE